MLHEKLGGLESTLVVRLDDGSCGSDGVPSGQFNTLLKALPRRSITLVGRLQKRGLGFDIVLDQRPVRADLRRHCVQGQLLHLFRRACPIQEEVGGVHQSFSVGLDDGHRGSDGGGSIGSRSEILQQTFLLFGRDVRVAYLRSLRPLRLDRTCVRVYDVPMIGRRRRIVIRGANRDQRHQRRDDQEVEELPPEACARRLSRHRACHDAPIQGSLQSRFTIDHDHASLYPYTSILRRTRAGRGVKFRRRRSPLRYTV